MAVSHGPLWTLNELSRHVASALRVGYSGQVNGRIREVPDNRTIRYYTTLGLIDRPAAMRGRTALYGRRHLLQLVAIKRLQAEGLPLAEIQSRVVGRTDAVLRRLARLPEGADRHQTVESDRQQTAETDRHQTVETAEEDRRAGPFWRAAPAPVAEGEQKSRGRNGLSLAGVPLAEGVTLLLEVARPVDDHDLEALRAAAAPLVKILKVRRLLEGEAQPQAAETGPQRKGESP